MTTRAAHPSDAPVLVGLLAQLGYPTTIAALTDRLEALARSDSDAILVLDGGDEVCAVIHVQMMTGLHGRPIAEIRALVVDEAKRGRGLGRRLVDAAREWARGNGADRLRVRTRVEREDALRFYRREGFDERKRQSVLVSDLADRASAPAYRPPSD